MTEKPKLEKMEPYTDEWYRMACREARNFCPPIRPCKDCGRPVVQGYCCNFCGSVDP